MTEHQAYKLVFSTSVTSPGDLYADNQASSNSFVTEGIPHSIIRSFSSESYSLLAWLRYEQSRALVVWERLPKVAISNLYRKYAEAYLFWRKGLLVRSEGFEPALSQDAFV
jgi:hypothetical protein